MPFKPNLLRVPPYISTCPPAGAAALLGYLKANGCEEIGFLDLRLYVHPENHYTPTYRQSGIFGESYALDVPDLPLVLHILKQHDRRRPLSDDLLEDWFIEYCVGRGIRPQVLAAYIRRMDRFLENSLAQHPDIRFIGFSVWTSNLLTTLMAASHLKHRRNPPFIVAGGPQVTESSNSAMLGLRSGLFDAVALGEGEETLLSLYEAFSRDGKRVDIAVPGTMQVDSSTGEFISSQRPLLRLQQLPLPDFSEMMISSYRSKTGVREIPYQLSRGCTDKCSFCSEWVFWQRIRIATMKTAVDDVRELVGRYGAEVIHFTDSLLNASMSRLREFAEAMLARGTAVPWFGFMRAEMDPETVDLIHRAGCYKVFVGVESLADPTLEKMHKRRTESDNIRALDTFLGAGINVVAGLIAGFPGDTRERFGHTVRVLSELQEKYPSSLEISTEQFILSPAQPMYKELDNYGISRQPWAAEVVDSAGRYADIASQVAFTFTGQNQGLDRFGETQMAYTLLNVPFQHKASHGTYSQLDPDFRHLYNDVFLARMPGGDGIDYSLIVTQTEKDEYERMRAGEKFSSEQPDELLTDRRLYAPLLNKLDQQHTLGGPRRRFSMFRTYHPDRLDGESRLRASPFATARVVGSELVVAHSLTLVFVRLPAAAASWFASVAEHDRPASELAAEALHARLTVTIDELAKKGLLTVTGPIAASKPFSPAFRVLSTGTGECNSSHDVAVPARRSAV